MNYEQEEEFLTNDLSRKLAQVQYKSSAELAVNKVVIKDNYLKQSAEAE